MDLDRIRENLARIFLGRVTVRSRPAGIATPEMKTVKRTVETRPLRPPARAMGTLMLGGAMGARVSGGVLPFPGTAPKVNSRLLPMGTGAPSVRGWSNALLGEAAVKKFKFSGAVARKDLKKALSLPQERMNRLRFVRGKLPLREGEIPLAYFWPLIREGVVKSALNKEKGALLVWYNPHSRAFFPDGLFLARRLGPGGGMEWRWTGLKRQR